MQICHYTTIETLALILKYRTIRFNRLDRVDDIEEASLGYGNLYSKLGSYQFVSCWSKDLEENISLWNMYTNFRGVRISLDEDMFVSYGMNEKIKSYFPEALKVENDYIIFDCNNIIELYDVIYVKNLAEKIKDLAKHSVLENGSVRLEYKDQNIGIYKRDHWMFQKEARFKIVVQPIDSSIPKENNFNSLNKIMQSMGTRILNNKPIIKEYFDIPLHEKAFNNMRIILAPLTTESDRIIVESLIKNYASNEGIKIEDSYLKDKIKKANK